MLSDLFGSQCDDGILVCRDTRGYEAGNDRQKHADGNKRNSGQRRQHGVNGVNARQVMDDGVYRDAQQYRCQYADKSGSEAYNDGLGVKYAGYILLRCADGPQYTDLLCALKEAYLCLLYTSRCV